MWWAPLDVAQPARRALATCLSAEEQRRADRLVSVRDRERFLAARGWLRAVLGNVLDCEPGEVRIVTDRRGKPLVHDSDLRFSASRSADIALFATSWTTDVGVDVEAIRDGVDGERIAARFFSPAEQRALASLAAPQQQASFFDCWARKEAYAKATGVGIGSPLQSADVWLADDRPVPLNGWWIHTVDLAAGFAAAVCAAPLGGIKLSAPHKLNPQNLTSERK